MTLTIPHPRVLLAVLALVALAGIAYTVAADEGPKDPPLEFIPVGSAPELPRVTADEGAQARARLAADPVFSALATGGQWTVTAEVANTLEGKKVGVGLVVQLGQPTDSEGPWKQLFCKGTVTVEHRFPYKGITSVGAVFDSQGRLIGLAPLMSPGTSLGADPDTIKQDKPQCPAT